MSIDGAKKVNEIMANLNYEMEQRATELAMDVRALGLEGVSAPPSTEANAAVLVRQQGMILALTNAVNSLGSELVNVLLEQVKRDAGLGDDAK